jgi:RNA polymerase sigma factor (sigma-70 family)
VKSIRDSVIRATDIAAPVADRHDAFADLVVRFQDMAFAYSFAVVGDACLAEDVAQEAFITAWHKLPQLREPEAFPGWFKRIVGTQINRLLRSRRLQFVASESAIEGESYESAPDHSAERSELVEKILKEIRRLPENQRIVTILFYVDGYTQDDIGHFLDLPTSTVNKRLYTARQKLKETIVEAVRTDLKQQRPSRNSNFSNQVNARLRPLSTNDWSSITRIAFGGRHRDAPGEEAWIMQRKNIAKTKYLRRDYIAEDVKTKRILGYGAIEQSIYLPRYKLLLVAKPSVLRNGGGDLLLDQLFEDLKQVDAITVSCQAHSSNRELINLLRARGFDEITTELDSRLLLNNMQVGSSLTTVEALGKVGVTISTLAKERETDPKYAEKLHQLKTELAEQDDDVSIRPPAYNSREARLWLEMKYVLPDGYFIAKHNNDYVGVIDVNLLDKLPRGVNLNPPGVLPEFRKRGIGTCLMLHAIDYAAANGYAMIRTFNRSSEKSTLKLNERLGFETEFKLVTLEKCLRAVIPVVNPALLDEYSGTYRGKGPKSPETLEVRNESGRLTLECIGQKVELFPTTESDFFIKYFYGEVAFVRNDEGQIKELDFTQRTGDSVDRYRALKLDEEKHR